MIIRAILAMTGVAFGFISPTFARQKDPIDPKIDQQIHALATKFDEAYNKNDPTAVAALYTEERLGSTQTTRDFTVERPSKNRLPTSISSAGIPTISSRMSIG